MDGGRWGGCVVVGIVSLRNAPIGGGSKRYYVRWYFSGMKHSGWGGRGKRDDMYRWYLPRTSQLMEETGRVDDVGRWYFPRISQLIDDRKSMV